MFIKPTIKSKLENVPDVIITVKSVLEVMMMIVSDVTLVTSYTKILV